MPAKITNTNINIAGIIASFETPLVEMKEKQMDKIKVIKNTSIIHFK